MRVSPALFAALGLCAGIMIASDAVEAQSRDRDGLSVTVRKRSYLDAGPVAPVGSMNRYSTFSHSQTPIGYAHKGSIYGEETLPERRGNSLFGF